MKYRGEQLARRGVTQPALIDSVREGEAVADVKQRLGKPAEERWSVRSERVRQDRGNAGTTTHVIEPAVDARFVRLNVIRPTYNGEPVARIYEFEVYGPDGRRESRARPSRDGEHSVRHGSGAREGRERQRGGRRGRPAGAPETGRCSCRWISARPAR